MIAPPLFLFVDATLFGAIAVRSDDLALNTSLLGRACERLDHDDIVFGCAAALLIVLTTLSNRWLARRSWR